ncbi:MAG: dTDP-4-dehydrorhamnose 3,5-epimerase [Rhodospirillales bacterium]
MKFHETGLAGVLLVEPTVFDDPRGHFFEVHHRDKFAAAGIGLAFVQDNHSHSTKGTVRGLHFQEPHAQGKLVRAVNGEIFDVAVDIRKGSPTFGQWTGHILSAANRRQLWVPPGFAHGLCALSDTVDVIYKCTDVYAPEDEHGIAWNDPDIGIEWPIETPVLSDKDSAAPMLKDCPVLPACP